MTEAMRDTLGKVVRETWVKCKQEEVMAGTAVKPEHLWPWENIPEREREVDRRIGEAVAAYLDSCTTECDTDAQVYDQKPYHCKLCGKTFICDNGMWSTICDCARTRPDELAAVQAKWDATRSATRSATQPEAKS